MTRAGVDSYIPFFGRDFLAATMGWTAEERGHYVTLLITQWEQGSIPAQIDRIELVSAGVSRCWQTLEPKFPVDGDGLRRNRRMEEHRGKAESLKATRAEKAAKAAKARWSNAPSNAPSNAQALPGGMPGHRSTDSLPKPPCAASSVSFERGAGPHSPSNASSNAPSISQAMLERCPPSPSPINKKEEESTSLAVFPCEKGTWTPTPEMIEEWQSAFPSLNIAEQLRMARLWCVENPTRRKTQRGMRRFVSSWLGNASTRRGPLPAQQAGRFTKKVLASL